MIRVGAGILDQVKGLHRRALEPYNSRVFYPGQVLKVCEKFDSEGMPIVKCTVTVISIVEADNLLEFERNISDEIKVGDFLVV